MDGKKRKRDAESPIVIFHLADRAGVARLLDEGESYSQMVDAIKSKLNLSNAMLLRLEWSRDGRQVALSDDDDMSAFRAYARFASVVDVNIVVDASSTASVPFVPQTHPVVPSVITTPHVPENSNASASVAPLSVKKPTTPRKKKVAKLSSIVPPAAAATSSSTLEPTASHSRGSSAEPDEEVRMARALLREHGISPIKRARFTNTGTTEAEAALPSASAGSSTLSPGKRSQEPQVSVSCNNPTTLSQSILQQLGVTPESRVSSKTKKSKAKKAEQALQPAETSPPTVVNDTVQLATRTPKKKKGQKPAPTAEGSEQLVLNAPPSPTSVPNITDAKAASNDKRRRVDPSPVHDETLESRNVDSNGATPATPRRVSKKNSRLKGSEPVTIGDQSLEVAGNVGAEKRRKAVHSKPSVDEPAEPAAETTEQPKSRVPSSRRDSSAHDAHEADIETASGSVESLVVNFLASKEHSRRCPLCGSKSRHSHDQCSIFNGVPEVLASRIAKLKTKDKPRYLPVISILERKLFEDRTRSADEALPPGPLLHDSRMSAKKRSSPSPSAFAVSHTGNLENSHLTAVQDADPSARPSQGRSQAKRDDDELETLMQSYENQKSRKGYGGNLPAGDSNFDDEQEDEDPSQFRDHDEDSQPERPEKHPRFRRVPSSSGDEFQSQDEHRKIDRKLTVPQIITASHITKYCDQGRAVERSAAKATTLHSNEDIIVSDSEAEVDAKLDGGNGKTVSMDSGSGHDNSIDEDVLEKRTVASSKTGVSTLEALSKASGTQMVESSRPQQSAASKMSMLRRTQSIQRDVRSSGKLPLNAVEDAPNPEETDHISSSSDLFGADIDEEDPIEIIAAAEDGPLPSMPVAFENRPAKTPAQGTRTTSKKASVPAIPVATAASLPSLPSLQATTSSPQLAELPTSSCPPLASSTPALPKKRGRPALPAEERAKRPSLGHERPKAARPLSALEERVRRQSLQTAMNADDAHGTGAAPPSSLGSSSAAASGLVSPTPKRRGRPPLPAEEKARRQALKEEQIKQRAEARAKTRAEKTAPKRVGDQADLDNPPTASKRTAMNADDEVQDIPQPNARPSDVSKEPLQIRRNESESVASEYQWATLSPSSPAGQIVPEHSQSMVDQLDASSYNLDPEVIPHISVAGELASDDQGGMRPPGSAGSSGHLFAAKPGGTGAAETAKNAATNADSAENADLASSPEHDHERLFLESASQYGFPSMTQLEGLTALTERSRTKPGPANRSIDSGEDAQEASDKEDDVQLPKQPGGRPHINLYSQTPRRTRPRATPFQSLESLYTQSQTTPLFTPRSGLLTPASEQGPGLRIRSFSQPTKATKGVESKSSSSDDSSDSSEDEKKKSHVPKNRRARPGLLGAAKRKLGLLSLA